MVRLSVFTGVSLYRCTDAFLRCIGATTFPAVTESLTLDNDFEQAAIEVTRLIAALQKISEKLLTH